ncbi:YoaK family protein [Lactobacillus sp. YT155]|uniref:YoaK family protein n=1 Tax=Lactobacillus sp. YT155 TaxID=3060955 RepID=UPI00265FEA7E|nr:YoaK family protein [Lactobacillus sp. YT155]MDO1604858.1 YoaK family protein [Lactobacillus sp. YT155]
MDNFSPIHERTMVAQLLALTSGSIDAYSFLTHGNVFAGMQTGNLILMGINLAYGRFGLLINYLVPILVFIIGATFTKYMSLKFTHYHNISRQALVLSLGIVLLILVGIIGNQISLIFTSLLMSVTIALLFTEFDKIHDAQLNAVMMTGNFKKLGTLFLEGMMTKQSKLLRRSFRVFRIILSFFIGVIINAYLVKIFSFQAIFFSAMMLGGVLIIIAYDNHKLIKQFTGDIND